MFEHFSAFSSWVGAYKNNSLKTLLFFRYLENQRQCNILAENSKCQHRIDTCFLSLSIWGFEVLCIYKAVYFVSLSWYMTSVGFNLRNYFSSKDIDITHKISVRVKGIIKKVGELQIQWRILQCNHTHASCEKRTISKISLKKKKITVITRQIDVQRFQEISIMSRVL